MHQIYKKTSQNGQWGVALVSETDIDRSTLRQPQRGHLRDIGDVAGVRTFVFTPAEDGHLYLLNEEDTDPVEAATTINYCALQGNNYAAIIAISNDFSVVRRYGYKRRHSNYVAFRNGAEVSLPDTVLAASGLIKTQKNEKVRPEIPAISSAMADALAAAGLA